MNDSKKLDTDKPLPPNPKVFVQRVAQIIIREFLEENRAELRRRTEERIRILTEDIERKEAMP